MEYKGAFKSALEDYKMGQFDMNEPVKINSDRIPVKSKIYKCVCHITSSEFSTNSSVDVIRERKSMVAKQLLQELTQWKAQILSLPDVRSAKFEDRVNITVSSTEIRGEALTVFKSFNDLMIDPRLEYIEIAHAPDIAWHKGE